MSEKNIAGWIQDELENIPFVDWDRYVIGAWSDNMDFLTVYGWIDREDDDYKDFVEVTFWDDKGRMFTTSSERYTEEIHRCLFDDPIENHNSCQRVENGADIDNVVEL